MSLICWLFGHIFQRSSGSMTEVTIEGGIPMVTGHREYIDKLACCERCGKINPEFVNDQQQPSGQEQSK